MPCFTRLTPRPFLAQYEEIKDKGFACIPIGNHDLSRLNIGRTADELEMIFAFSITMPGIPFIYYGNEIGMRQLYDLPHVEGAYKPRAGARTPMQWSRGRNAGFSETSPDRLYLPVDAAEDFPNAEDQEKDPDSMLNRVRRLIAMKKNHGALSAHAEFVPLYATENAYPFVYARAAGDEAVLVALNPSAKPAQAAFACNIGIEGRKLLAGREAGINRSENGISLELPGQTYSIYSCKVN